MNDRMLLELAYRILNAVNDSGVDIQGIAEGEGYDTEEIKQFMKEMGVEYDSHST